MEGFNPTFRVGMLAIIVIFLSIAVGERLYDMQIINGISGPVQTERKITTSTIIPASRGEILDRYGRPLITNKLSYSVTIDERRLKLDEDPSALILSLINFTHQAGFSYEDNFPVTNPPFRYTENSTHMARLKRFLAKKEWKEDITAPELMTKLREHYMLPDDIDEYNARLIIGVRYEIELRIEVPSVPPYTFASDITMELVTVIKEHSLSGVNIEPLSKREYKTDYAAHILGRVSKIPEEEYEEYKSIGYAGDEIVGVDGAEKAFEQWLRGVSGVKTEETNMAGKVQNVIYSKEPKPGNNIYLTIDIRLQEEVERALERHIVKMRENGKELKGKESEAGAAVVIDVNSGEILAMANYPTYSLKTFAADYQELLEDPLKPMVNRSISSAYSPGSTYKMVTAAAGLGEEVITPKTLITDKGRFTYYSDYQPVCHVYPGSHGTINVKQALQKSCNYYFYDIGLKLGIENQKKWANLFGLGLPTGIELTFTEKTGYVAGPETSALLGQTWYPGLTLAAAIGQSDNAFTPLAIANYTATIANGGSLNNAHLLMEAVTYDYSQTIHKTESTVRNELGLSEEAMAAIQEGMRMVAQPGGTAASTFGNYSIPVAAKTGSVQVTSVPNNGVFVAYAPYDNPEIAVCVVIEKGGAGSAVAPVAKDIFDAYFSIHREMTEKTSENELRR